MERLLARAHGGMESIITNHLQKGRVKSVHVSS